MAIRLRILHQNTDLQSTSHPVRDPLGAKGKDHVGVCVWMCVCVTEWVRDDPSSSNLRSSVLKRHRSTLELVFYLNPRHSHKQKYFPDTQEGTIEEAEHWKLPVWIAEGSTGRLDGGKGGRGPEEQKERRIYDPVRKGQDSSEVFGLSGLFIAS